jgi:hypothetical protein
MQDLNFKVGIDNFGGVDRFWFAREEDILEENEQGLVLLKPGAVWFLGRCTRYTLEFSNPHRESRSGKVFSPRLSGMVSRHTPELETVLDEMRDNRFVIIYKDRNNYLMQIGGQAEPLTFTTEQATGDSPAAKNGVRIEFAGDTTRRPIPYSLEIETSPEAPTAPSQGAPALLFYNGNLIGSIPSGGSAFITSEFSREFELNIS